MNQMNKKIDALRTAKNEIVASLKQAFEDFEDQSNKNITRARAHLVSQSSFTFIMKIFKEKNKKKNSFKLR